MEPEIGAEGEVEGWGGGGCSGGDGRHGVVGEFVVLAGFRIVMYLSMLQ